MPVLRRRRRSRRKLGLVVVVSLGAQHSRRGGNVWRQGTFTAAGRCLVLPAQVREFKPGARGTGAALLISILPNLLLQVAKIEVVLFITIHHLDFSSEQLLLLLFLVLQTAMVLLLLLRVV